MVRTLTSSLTTEGAAATKVLYVLHGIFGAGRNWASVMRRFVRSRPEWACRLLDLRQHGDSQGFPPPHSITAAAADIAQLAEHNQETPAAILGHSFGGKVALMYARTHGEQLEQVWVIDSTPDARVPDGSAWQMLQLVRQSPREFAARNELVELLARHGISTPTAQWMATNLEQVDGVYRWRFDLDAIEALLRDFFEQDLWDVLEQPPGKLKIHIVKAEESSVLSPTAIQRIEAMASNKRVFLHYLAGGHWVNADNPEALLAIMTRYL